MSLWERMSALTRNKYGEALRGLLLLNAKDKRKWSIIWVGSKESDMGRMKRYGSDSSA